MAAGIDLHEPGLLLLKRIQVEVLSQGFRRSPQKSRARAGTGKPSTPARVRMPTVPIGVHS